MSLREVSTVCTNSYLISPNLITDLRIPHLAVIQEINRRHGDLQNANIFSLCVLSCEVAAISSIENNSNDIAPQHQCTNITAVVYCGHRHTWGPKG